jgi:bifunctional non-homologous end joining protein LigD
MTVRLDVHASPDAPVRMLPSAPLLSPSAVMVASSGASTIATISYCTSHSTISTPSAPIGAFVEAVAALRVRSCLIDGEAVCCDDNGVAVFAKLRQRRNDRHVVLYAFDLLEPDGQDLRREPLVRRKVLLPRLLARAMVGLQVNDHIAAAGEVVFRHACQLGLEGIVSKRLGSRYVSGRTRDWLKFKNPAAAAVQREAEEDWG